MSDLRELYQQVILDHSKNPRHFGKIENPTHDAWGHNPLCGDKVHLYLTLENDLIKDIQFEGSGCAISTASVSMLTESLIGKSISEVEPLFKKFHHIVTGEGEDSDIDLGKLEVFAGVQEFPTRVKCATLGWHTLKAAINQEAEPAKTE